VWGSLAFEERQEFAELCAVGEDGVAAEAGLPAREECVDEERRDLRRVEVADFACRFLGNGPRVFVRVEREGFDERAAPGLRAFPAVSSLRRAFWYLRAARAVLHAFTWRWPSLLVQRA
jgi:hypothetical protein